MLSSEDTSLYRSSSARSFPFQWPAVTYCTASSLVQVTAQVTNGDRSVRVYPEHLTISTNTWAITLLPGLPVLCGKLVSA